MHCLAGARHGLSLQRAVTVDPKHRVVSPAQFASDLTRRIGLASLEIVNFETVGNDHVVLIQDGQARRDPASIAAASR